MTYVRIYTFSEKQNEIVSTDINFSNSCSWYYRPSDQCLPVLLYAVWIERYYRLPFFAAFFSFELGK